MDVDEEKVGAWPNIAVPAGSDPQAVMRKHNRKPPSVLDDDAWRIAQLESLVRDASWLLVIARWNTAEEGVYASDWLDRAERLGLEVRDG